MQSTTGSISKVICNEQIEWCNMDCLYCSKARVLCYAPNETSSSAGSIHMMEAPIYQID